MEETNSSGKKGLNETSSDDTNKMADLITIEYEDCPVCLENAIVEKVCPNNHKLCLLCAEKVRTIKNHRTNKASCPICRADIPYVPERQPIVAVNMVEVFAMEDAYNNQQAQPRRARESMNQQWGRWVREEQGIVGLFDPRIADQRKAEAKRLAHRNFRNNQREGKIPQTAEFGGCHSRKCGHEGCNRRGGEEGVRFLLFGDTGKRRYRCEQHTE